jgi:hypothetical protein
MEEVGKPDTGWSTIARRAFVDTAIPIWEHPPMERLTKDPLQGKLSHVKEARHRTEVAATPPLEGRAGREA